MLLASEYCDGRREFLFRQGIEGVGAHQRAGHQKQ
jgi:hypothetical protein